MREKMAEIEHEQWMQWAKALLPELKELTKHHLPYGDERETGNCACKTCQRIERWERECFKPYNELSEEMKNHDRKWADKILALEVPESITQDCTDIEECIQPMYMRLSSECAIVEEGYPCPHYQSRPATIKDLTLD